MRCVVQAGVPGCSEVMLLSDYSIVLWTQNWLGPRGVFAFLGGICHLRREDLTPFLPTGAVSLFPSEHLKDWSAVPNSAVLGRLAGVCWSLRLGRAENRAGREAGDDCLARVATAASPPPL